jgi:RHS repeat-associated protein
VFLQGWNAGDFSVFPPIEIRSQAELGGAKGAYSGERDTVYLAQELLAQNTDNISPVVDVLLEEIGHFLDQRLSVGDLPGDEGAIFSAVVRGEVLSPQQLAALQAEDDHAVVELDGEAVAVEKADVEFGDSVTGNISTVGEENSYTFSAVAGDVLKLQIRGFSGVNPYVELHDPLGNIVASAGTSSADSHTTATLSENLSQTGDYTLQISDFQSNDTGSYEFSFDRFNDPINSTDITFGSTLSGDIDFQTELSFYKFEADAGDELALQLHGESAVNPNVQIFDVNGNLVASAGRSNFDDHRRADLTTTLGDSGAYTLQITDHWINETGGYNFSLNRFNNPLNTIDVEFGDNFVGETEFSSEYDVYRLEADAGDVLRLQLNSTSSLTPHVQVRNSAGTFIASTPVDNFDNHKTADLRTLLDEEGVYYLWVDDNWSRFTGNQFGGYNFSLENVSNSATATLFPFGSQISETLNPGSDLDNFTFNGTAGDVVRLRMASTSNINPRLELYDGAGNLVEFNGSSTFDTHKTAQIQTELNETGNYTILASDYRKDQVGFFSNDIGGYDLEIARVFLGGTENNLYNLNSLNAVGSVVEDQGGVDTLDLSDIPLALSGLSVGVTGLGRDDEDLLVDINQDGLFNRTDDLVIDNFFVPSIFRNEAGFGFIETIGSFSGADVLDLNLIDIDINNLGVLSGTQFFEDYVGEDNSTDLYRFELVEDGGASLVLSDLGEGASASIQLLSSDGSVLSASSDLISSNLSAGVYYARVNKGAGNTNYTLRISDKEIPDLGPNTFDAARNLGVLQGTQTVSDFVGDSDPKDLYRFRLTEPSTVNLVLNGLGADADIQLRDSEGNFIAGSSLSGTASETISQALATGTYYVQVDRHQGDTNYNLQLSGNSVPFQIRDITPDEGSNAGQVTLTIEGNQFTPAATFSLLDENSAAIAASQTTWQNSTTVVSTFDLTGKTTGLYDLQVEDAAGTVVADDIFTINSAAPGQLALSLAVRSSMRPWQTGEAVITYENIGQTDIISPLLLLEMEGGVVIPSLRPLNEIFNETPIQLVGNGEDGTPGILTPGETGTISLPFRPESGAVRVDFGLSTPQSTGVVDWETFKQQARPVGVSDEAWDAVWANFTESVGTTGGEYEAVLAENAARLGELGNATADAKQLLGFELRQASNFGNLLEKYNLGLFGRGQTLHWDIQAITDDDGNVILRSSSGLRVFEKLANDNNYQAPSGDYGTLIKVGGTYQLHDQDGTILAFRSDGKLDYIEDTNGNQTTTTYSGSQLTGVTNFDGYSLSFSYNPQGRISAITDDAGRTTTYSYDAVGEHLLAVTDPLGLTTSYTYDANHGITSITNSDGTQALFTYDSQGRLIQQSLTAGEETFTYSYDSAGGVTATDADGAETQWLFNGQGQIGQIEDALGRITQLSYDNTGNLTQLIAPGNTKSTFSYDARGNLLSQIDPEGNRVQFTYEPDFDQIASVSDPKSNVTRYGYDGRGNLRTVTYADGTAESYSYDSRGNLTRFVNRRGQTLTYGHNSKNQLIRKTLPGGVITTYTYDAVGNLTSATDSSGTVTLAHDAANQLTQITYPNGRSLSYSYDAAGRRTQMVNQDGYTVTYGYDAAGRLTTVSDGGVNPLVIYSYDSVGRLEQEVNGNGTTTTYSYDAASQLLSIVNAAPDSSVNSRFDYTYDDLGRRTTMTTLEGTWTYGYDASGQLTAVTLPNGRHIEYAYDAAGNRITVNDDGVTTDYSTNNLNQYTSVGDATHTYDADGNLIAKTENGELTTYAYNAENRLIQVVNSGGIWTYEYDALGNRIASTLNGKRTEYLVDPTGLGDVVGEYGENNNLIANYVHGLGLETRVDFSATAAFYDFDAIGSTTGLTDATGSHVNQYSYLPFGEELIKVEAIDNPFEYIGQFGTTNEGNGLEFMRSRFYESSLGRFTQDDPIGILGGINLLAYAGNNPVSFADPLGLFQFYIDVPGEFLLEKYWDKVLPVLGKAGKGIIKFYASTTGTALGVIWELAFPPDVEAPEPPDTGSPEDQKPSNPQPPNPGNEPGCQNQGNFPGGYDPCAGEPSSSGGTSAPAGSSGDWGWDHGWSDDPGWWNAGWWDDGGDNGGNGGDNGGDDDGNGNGSSNGGNWWDDWGSWFTNILIPFDPNDVVGPAGFGPEGWLIPNQVLPYTIRFENAEDATAPAAFITITQQLDSDLDWTSVELSSFGFNNLIFDVPEGLQAYNERLDLVDEIGYFVDINGKIDTLTGELSWHLRTIDPVTDDLPDDPLAGFLPPNDDTHAGEGFVSYRVRPLSGLTTGTALTAEADIIFDTNDPIATPVYLNTVDIDSPSSAVTVLPPTVDATHFAVNWAGTDLGSGIATYDIYVSENGSAYSLWLDDTTDTAATYTGIDGNTYSFYSVATDNVGLTENAPVSADATTTVTIPVVDSEAPVSAVLALPATVDVTDFTVSWSGTDNDSGIASYDIFVSENGGAYSLWLDDTTDTAATYTGIDGNTYDFYSVAIDAVGNIEAAPATADATTTLKIEPDNPGSDAAIDTINSDANDNNVLVIDGTGELNLGFTVTSPGTGSNKSQELVAIAQDTAVTSLLFTLGEAAGLPKGFDLSNLTTVNPFGNGRFEFALRDPETGELKPLELDINPDGSGFKLPSLGIEFTANTAVTNPPDLITESDSLAIETLDVDTLIGMAGSEVVNLEFTLFREAAYNNFVGFYAVDALTGQVLDSSGSAVAGTNDRDAYMQAILDHTLIELFAPDDSQSIKTTASLDFSVFGTDVEILPYLIANGSPDTVKADFHNLYTPVLGMNSDGADHIRHLANNTLGFEDLFNGGDHDFDDVVLQVALVD